MRICCFVEKLESCCLNFYKLVFLLAILLLLDSSRILFVRCALLSSCKALSVILARAMDDFHGELGGQSRYTCSLFVVFSREDKELHTHWFNGLGVVFKFCSLILFLSTSTFSYQTRTDVPQHVELDEALMVSPVSLILITQLVSTAIVIMGLVFERFRHFLLLPSLSSEDFPCL